jgi:hypothetical protein
VFLSGEAAAPWLGAAAACSDGDSSSPNLASRAAAPRPSSVVAPSLGAAVPPLGATAVLLTRLGGLARASDGSRDSSSLDLATCAKDFGPGVAGVPALGAAATPLGAATGLRPGFTLQALAVRAAVTRPGDAETPSLGAAVDRGGRRSPSPGLPGLAAVAVSALASSPRMLALVAGPWVVPGITV